MQRSRSIAISGESSSGLPKWRLGSMKRERPAAPAEGDVLQRALAALVADRAVERVVDEQELDDRLWASRTRSVWVWTTMPSLTGVEHAVWSFGMPSISTRHMRQAPTGLPSLGS